MTTTYRESTELTGPTWPMYAALGVGTALALAAVGTFANPTGNSASEQGLREFLIVAGIVVVAAAVVFGIVARTAAEAGAATRALVLAILGLLSLALFWTGLPPVLAFGAIACATAAGRGGTLPGRAKVAMGLALVTVALAVVAAIVG
ncbi:MAG TPA: hypothetical protein VLO09_04995 [Ornithinimicrobium sp.]|nr:hypothetical protein [Ornithinimicrobium sp.]